MEIGTAIARQYKPKTMGVVSVDEHEMAERLKWEGDTTLPCMCNGCGCHLADDGKPCPKCGSSAREVVMRPGPYLDDVQARVKASGIIL